jgi:hypothetical protein
MLALPAAQRMLSFAFAHSVGSRLFAAPRFFCSPSGDLSANPYASATAPSDCCRASRLWIGLQRLRIRLSYEFNMGWASMDVRFERKLAEACCAGLISVAALAGCANAPATSATYQSPDSRTFAENAMSTGPMLVEIQGRPYAASAEQTDDAVLRAMRDAMSWRATPRLTTDPAAKMPSMGVMTFNGGGVDANVQCGASEGGEPQPQGAVRVTASFCGNGSLIANSSGHIDTSSGVDDPLFAELIRQVAYDLFPQSEQQPPGTGIGIGGGAGGIGIGGGRSGFGIGSGGGIGIGIGF